MFSGIKSLIFGYSDENPASASDGSCPTSDPPIIGANSTIIEASASSSLEQTLNAATTKLTEQLSPLSTSIEQLQSSSHQLLPSLNEQQAEDELRKATESLVSQAAAVVCDTGDDADDECFNADSWEMLDLVEKPTVRSLNLSVQQEESATCEGPRGKSALKSSLINKPNVDNASVVVEKKKRKKHKVSFETSDLVIINSEIEQTIDPPPAAGGYESDVSIGEPVSMLEVAAMVEEEGQELELELPDVEVVEALPSELPEQTERDSVPAERELSIDEGQDGRAGRKFKSGEKRSPTQVKPIEPERLPGWQLRKKRPQRRPLAPVTLANSSLLADRASGGSSRKESGGGVAGAGSKASRKLQPSPCDSSADSSGCPTPTLIDRIGSSLVANLSNLTSGFVSPMASAGSLHSDELQGVGVGARPAASVGAAGACTTSAAAAIARANSTKLAANRKRLSKGYLDRQNGCAKEVLKRPDRRQRMHAVRNGVSVDRKVHTKVRSFSRSEEK